MASTGACHSDLHVKDGCCPNWHFPAVLGHEGAGVVESVGEGVTSVKAGEFHSTFSLLSNYKMLEISSFSFLIVHDGEISFL